MCVRACLSAPLSNSLSLSLSLCSQSSLAQLGIPLNDVLKVLIAVLLLGNILFYEAKNQELSFQGADGELLDETKQRVLQVIAFSAYMVRCLL